MNDNKRIQNENLIEKGARVVISAPATPPPPPKTPSAGANVPAAPQASSED